MSGPERLDRAGVDLDAVVGFPMTGEAAVDDALLSLAELASTPLTEHHDQLARAHESLYAALHADTPDGPTPRR